MWKDTTMKTYRCILCIAGEHCKGDSNNNECECGCVDEELNPDKPDMIEEGDK